MKRILMKRGPKSYPLSIEQKERLMAMFDADPTLTLPKLAKLIGITTAQLVNPLRGHQKCSEVSYRRIERLLEKHREELSHDSTN
jgi:hypothetical protein